MLTELYTMIDITAFFLVFIIFFYTVGSKDPEG